jgi:phytoene desaturase
LLFYIGTNKKIAGIQHHNLFFDEDFELHAKEIYTDPQWPSKPFFTFAVPPKQTPMLHQKVARTFFPDAYSPRTG